MRYNRVYIDGFGFELPAETVTTATLEQSLAPLYRKLGIADGQVEALTGVVERRFWPRGTRLSEPAARAAAGALHTAGIRPSEIGSLVYASVCRDALEPATACAVAHALGLRPDALIYDVGNACLGVLNGILDVANRIELGQIRAGLVVACESAREIIGHMTAQLLRRGDRTLLNEALATLTGGSGAVAVLLTDGSFPNGNRHRLMGGVARSAAEHHDLCVWGYREAETGGLEPFMRTDAPKVLRHGLELAQTTWRLFLDELGWAPAGPDRVMTHQVGRAHRHHMLEALELSSEIDFATYSFLGNMGTASLPLSTALAAERGLLSPGQRVGLLGIGSGLNCLMLGVEW